MIDKWIFELTMEDRVAIQTAMSERVRDYTEILDRNQYGENQEFWKGEIDIAKQVLEKITNGGIRKRVE